MQAISIRYNPIVETTSTITISKRCLAVKRPMTIWIWWNFPAFTTLIVQCQISAKLISKYEKIPPTVNAVETSITHTSERIDDIFRNSLPALGRHINEVATGLALQTMDLDVHRRKWTLTIHGLKGEAGEDEEVTRDACVKLAQDHLGIPNAASTDFAACHRLSKHASSGIIMRFRDLSTRNKWLGNAKELRHHSDTKSISPDPPPPPPPPALRPMKKELLAKREDMPQAQRSK